MQPTFSRRGPDLVTEELAAVLSTGTSFEFKPLFDVLHANLRARNAASGGEEMLRLRAYEKLQFMVQRGIVTKIAKKYKGVPSGLAKFIADAAELKSKLPSANHPRPSAISKVATITTPKGSKDAKAKLPVRKAQKGPRKESQKGRKAAA